MSLLATSKPLLCIVCGSIFGVLARLGIMLLTTYSGSYLGGVIWANFAACFIMGAAVESSSIWAAVTNSKGGTKASLPLYTGITTGFCGTFSSFSTVILEAFEKSADLELDVYYHYPNAAYGIMEFLSVILAQFGTSLLAFHLGKHFMEILEETGAAHVVISTRLYTSLECTVEVMAVASYIVVIVLIGTMKLGDWRIWTFSCLFAPVGAILRFYLSKQNAVIKGFPIGTFAANTIGSLVLGVLTLVLRGKLPAHHENQIITSVISCQVITGVDDGFCGALTTVSTFVSELTSLETKKAYKYGFASIAVSYCLVLLTLGTYNWSVGITTSVC